MKSVLVNFQPRGREYEYLIPDDLFDYVTVGSIVITPARVVGGHPGAAVVTQVRVESTTHATVVIEGIVAGQDECKLFKNKVVDVAAHESFPSAYELSFMWE